MAAKKSSFRKKAKSLLNKKKFVNKQAKKMSNKMTWPEREFVKLMDELEVNWEAQKIVGTKIYDFYLPDSNLLVEIHGDYYHANPLVYEGKKTNRMQERNMKNDKFKEILARGMGYDLKVVWEYDLKNNYYLLREYFEKL